MPIIQADHSDQLATLATPTTLSNLTPLINLQQLVAKDVSQKIFAKYAIYLLVTRVCKIFKIFP